MSIAGCSSSEANVGAESAPEVADLEVVTARDHVPQKPIAQRPAGMPSYQRLFRNQHHAGFSGALADATIGDAVRSSAASAASAHAPQ